MTSQPVVFCTADRFSINNRCRCWSYLWQILLHCLILPFHHYVRLRIKRFWSSPSPPKRICVPSPSLEVDSQYLWRFYQINCSSYIVELALSFSRVAFILKTFLESWPGSSCSCLNTSGTLFSEITNCVLVSDPFRLPMISPSWTFQFSSCKQSSLKH